MKTEEEVLEQLSDYNETKCIPPKPEYKLRGIVEWVMNKEPVTMGPKVNVGKVTFDAEAGKPWQSFFHSYDDHVNAPPLKFAIQGWLQENGITMYGALPGHNKTMIAMSTVKALLSGRPLFGHEHFAVERAKRVLYFCPEVGIGPLTHRLKLFGLMEYVGSGKLFVRTLSHKQQITLMDPRVLEAADGADVFLDTAIRFMEGDENSSTDQKVLSQNLFTMLTAGARTVTGLHHAPKGFDKQDYMSLENIFRGSGELSAMLSCAWGFKKEDEGRNEIFVQNVKARDFEAVGAFRLEGRPWIEQTGDFKMLSAPGLAGRITSAKQSGRPSKINQKTGELILKLHADGKSVREIAKLLSADLMTASVGKSAIGEYLQEHRPETKN